MDIIGAKGKVLGEVMHIPRVGLHASLPLEGQVVQKKLMRTEWLPSKPVLLGGAAIESRCGLLEVGK